MSEAAAFPSYVNQKPEVETLKYTSLVDDHLNKKIDVLLQQVEHNSENYDNSTKLLEALTKGILKGQTSIDFNEDEFKGVKGIIDYLHAEGLLDEIDINNEYKLDSKMDIEILKSKLEGIQRKLQNQSQIPLIKIQPLMNLLDLMIKIAKSIIDNWANLKGHITQHG